jgi:hypothetical protein
MKAELTIGKDYLIEKYPKNEIVRGKYLGEMEGMHFFETGRTFEKEYVIVEDKWAVFVDHFMTSFVTHTAISSCPIAIIPKDEVNKIEDRRVKSGLLKILNGGKK